MPGKKMYMEPVDGSTARMSNKKNKKRFTQSLRQTIVVLEFFNPFYMAFALNRAQIIGNVTRDPELRMAGASKVATFGVATNFSWIDKSGQKKEKVEFHNVVAWGKLADICEQYLKKGRKVFVEGRMQTRDWQGQDGVKRYRTEIIAENFILLDRQGQPVGGGAVGDREHAGITGGGSEDSSNESSMAPVGADEEEISIDDLPF